jgi:hypothetical protein
MDLVSQWVRRAAVLSTAVVVAVLVPAAAWAAEHPALVAVGAEVERRRRGFSLGFLPFLCCIVPLIVIVVVVVLIMRRRRPPS